MEEEVERGRAEVDEGGKEAPVLRLLLVDLLVCKGCWRIVFIPGSCSRLIGMYRRVVREK